MRAAIALAAVCGLATACSSATPSAPGVVVAPSAVTKIAATYSAANNRSNAALSQADQAKDEQGSALALDDAGYALEVRAGFKTADGSKYYPFSLAPADVSVPRQVGYPAKFEALLSPRDSAGTPSSYRSCPGGSQVDVFVKDSASAPWRVSLEPEVTTNLVPEFEKGSAGFAPAVRPDQKSQISLVGDLPSALESYARTGKLSDGLTQSDFGTSTQCWGIDDLRADVTAEARDHVSETITVSNYSPSDLTVVPLVSADESLALFSIKIVETYKPETAGEAIGWPHSSSNPLEDAVPAGTYSSVTVPEICEIAAIGQIEGSSKTGAILPPRIVGSNCSPLVGSGQKASPGQIVPVGPPSSALVLSQAVGR